MREREREREREGEGETYPWHMARTTLRKVKSTYSYILKIKMCLELKHCSSAGIYKLAVI